MKEKTEYDELETKLFSLNMIEKIQEKDATFEILTKELNGVFKKYEITSCIRKIHFLAQSYLESQRFMKSYESKPSSYVVGGDHYRGRGLLQLTHNYNYSAFYFDLYKKLPSDEELYDFAPKVSKELHLAVYASGYYWNKLNLNSYSDKDDSTKVSAAINYPKALDGEKAHIQSINHLSERKSYTEVIKKVFGCEKNCKNIIK